MSLHILLSSTRMALLNNNLTLNDSSWISDLLLSPFLRRISSTCKMRKLKIRGASVTWILLSIICGTVTIPLIQGQISTHPVVIGKLGSSASLTCHSNGVPLRLCLWEQKESDILIATFDQSNYRERLSSTDPYTFFGEGLEKGSCGIRIGVVKMDDLQRWKCTMLARDNATAVYRGSVLLQGAETLSSDPPSSDIKTGSEVEVNATSAKKQSQSESRNFHHVHQSPIVTAQGSASFAPAPTHSQHKIAPIQEVEVQSSGILVVPRRKGRKLVIL